MKSATSVVSRAVAATAAAAILTVGGASAAQATQGATLRPNQSREFATWFFGRTTVCFKNIGSTDGSVQWWSGPSSGGYGLVPGAEVCPTRSYAGIRLGVRNLSPQASIAVTFPIGP